LRIAFDYTVLLRTIASTVFVCLIVGCSSSDPGPIQIDEPEFLWQNLDSLLWAEMLAAEDSRADTDEGLAPIIAGLDSPSRETRQVAVRALGRLERPALVPLIVPLLQDTAAAVRAEAANALGQAVFRGEAGAAVGPLLARLEVEPDGYVRGIIAQTLGSLPYESSDTVRVVDAALVGTLEDSVPAALVGVARGLESLVRRQGAESAPSVRALERLRELARHRSVQGVGEVSAIQIRRLALSALVRSGQVDAGFLVTALVDSDAEVRRLALGAASTVEDLDGRMDVITRALNDESSIVRLAALTAYGRRELATSGCDVVIAQLDDPDPDVALTAIDLLGTGCRAVRLVLDRLTGIVEELVPGGGNYGSDRYPDSWHRPAHAFVALAAVAPGNAAPFLEAFATHDTWWVREYAARAAAVMDSVERLEELAEDDQDGVREAATTGLSRVLGHDADSHYRQQLTRRDYQLIMTAAGALDGTPNPAAALPALFDALDRISGERRETSRDVRRALLRRIGALGGRNQAVALIPYLRDFDPAIANEAARVLGEWTGRHYVAAPTRLPMVSLPSFGELAELAKETAVLEMSGGGKIELELLPFEAPTNVARFARLARAGYFDGLTFHRVARSFVVQGGSPGANEFVGDGPFTRDEVVKSSQLRGTVGISTRGRDTGDGQLFVNLVDNPRLDHNYTLIGEVVSGMDVVDSLLEGAVIERITWKPSGGRE
jgi:cyclophilin family peptidyl-prolyl cis-trans isomerase/HEAT repeat protein